MCSPHENANQPSISVFAVVVIYRIAPMESCSVVSLLTAARAAEPMGIRVHIRVADNTPDGQMVAPLPADLEYCAYPHNPGLVEPYNDGLDAARLSSCSWFLTLDQDTDLPADFLIRMTSEAAKYSNVAEVAGVVPHVADGDRQISPMCYKANFLPLVLPAEAHGIAPRHASAINSGSLLKCSALHSIGGYDPEFPLHNSDTRLFQKLDTAGYRLAVAKVEVSHELSILHREERIQPERYRKMLEDECTFWDRHMSASARVERVLRLAGRVIRGRLRNESRSFREITARELFRRLFTSRSQRLQTGQNPAVKTAVS